MTAVLEPERTQVVHLPLPLELWCGVCGYGVVVRDVPPACPMCRASCWDEQRRASSWN